jgi:pyrroline-5-carboxylate reductase
MKITIAGCGNMGLIYAKAFLKYNIISRNELLLAEKNETRKRELIKLGVGEVTVVNDPEIAESDMVILAVKPQDFVELAKELRPVIREKTSVISIMAGVRIGAIAETLGTDQIVRAMPNSPAELGLGMTAYACSADLSKERMGLVEKLLSATGRTAMLGNEEMLDAATALSGSGPAYFFYLVQQMIESGKEMGFTEEVSAMLVKQTMLGAFHLMNVSGRTLDELIRAVASKGGTTEAALTVFENENVGRGLKNGIVSARDRAKELSKK